MEIEQIKNEEREIKLMEILTNKPSDPIEIKDTKTRIVFQAPSITDKYKGRAWSAKKLKEIGVTDEDDQDLAYYFRYWGNLNTFVKRIYFENPHGDIKIGELLYSEYTFEPSRDLNYKFLFEKYAIEEMYARGIDELFVTSSIMAHMEWIKNRALEESDIKNS